MRKIISLTCIFFTCLFLTSCNTPDKYLFLHETSEIEYIMIVEVGEVDENDAQPTLKCVTVIEEQAFLEEFLAIECYYPFGPPHGVYSGEYAIKIGYRNGDYELITDDGQATYSYNEYYNEMYYNQHSGGYVFYGEELETLIMKYVNETKQCDN